MNKIFLILALTLLLNGALFTADSMKFEVIEDFRMDTENADLTWIKDFCTSDSGKIFLISVKQNKLFIFNKRGDFIKSVSQRGKGPGDLLNPLSITSHKDSVYVLEQGNQRVTLFNSNGVYIKSFPLNLKKKILKIKAVKSGQFIAETEADNPKGGQTVFIDLFSHDFKFIRNIYFKNILRRKLITSPIKLFIYDLPFYPDISWVLTDKDKLITGDQDKFKFNILNFNQKLIYSFSHKTHRLRVQNKDKEKIYEQYKVIGNNGVSKVHPNLKEAIPFHEFKPYFHTIASNINSDILIFPYSDKTHKNFIYLFSYKDKSVKKLATRGKPEIITSVKFTDKNIFYCITENKEEESIIRKYRVIY